MNQIENSMKEFKEERKTEKKRYSRFRMRSVRNRLP